MPQDKWIEEWKDGWKYGGLVHLGEWLEGYLCGWISFCLDEWEEEPGDYIGVRKPGSHDKVVNVQ